MNFTSVGDLSRIFTMRQSNASLRNEIQRLSQEVTTGVKADVVKHLNGDLVEFASIERGLKEGSAYQRVASEAAAVASTMQSALGAVQDIANQFGGTMLSDSTLSGASSLQSVADAAGSQLDDAISALNTSASGRFVMSGTRVDQPPLASAEQLMAEAEAVISGATSASEAGDLLAAWFSAPAGGGGFTDSIYQGSAGGAASVSVDPNTQISFGQTANDDGVKSLLFGLTVAKLVSQGAFAGDHQARAELMSRGGGALLQANGQITTARADLGMTEQVIERASTRLQAMRTNLQLERSNLIGADVYEAGSQLVQAEAQLEALFVVTARLSKLSLAKHL